MLVKHLLNAFQIYDIISGKVNQIAISNPIKTKVIAEARVKTDTKDARTLALLARLNAYYPVWVPPIKVRKKKGHNVAVVAVARKMLEVIWHILRYEEIYQYLEGAKYANKILNCAWNSGKGKNPEGAKETLKEAFNLIGMKSFFDTESSVSLNKIRKDKRIKEKLKRIRPIRRIYVLGR